MVFALSEKVPIPYSRLKLSYDPTDTNRQSMKAQWLEASVHTFPSNTSLHEAKNRDLPVRPDRANLILLSCTQQAFS